jgi:signal transduction histidine kinase/CheY-like chemotaxis protein
MGEKAAEVMEAVRTKGGWIGELVAKSKDGDFFDVQVAASIVINDTGQPVCMHASFADITERKLAEKTLKFAKEKAEAGDKLKTTFLNNISHEVRTPLNGILGFAEIMSQTDLSEEEKQVSLSMLFESSDRLLDTITNYMDISLITSGSMAVNRKDFVPEKIMKELLGKYKTICSGRKLELLLKLPEHSDKLSVNSDPEILTKIISHLLSNAIKFTEEGTIKYGYTINENELEFFVTDSGIGIGKESLTNIFDHFIKEDRGPLKITEGSGLGLSISKGMVELLGGRILVESETGKGSSFFFTIPYVKESEIRHSVTKTGSMNKKKPIKSILVAEDDEVNFFYINSILKKNTSADIIHASNGQEAIDKFKENQDIDLVLMDIKMPIVDGFAATREIKAIKKNVPVIAVTAYATTGDEDKALEAGCDSYLAKPINRKQLLEKIAEFISL